MKNDMMSMLGGLLSSAVSKGGQEKLENRTVIVDSKEYTFQVHTPPDVENTPNLPVIIFLHGIKQRGNGGLIPTNGAGGAIAKHYLGQVPAIILLPHCRLESYWSDPVMEKMVIESLAQTVEEFKANENRIYLTGVSMGGYGVWHLASQFPNKFAALVSICGGSSITKGDRFDALAKKVGKTPAWVFHGADDTVVPVTESRQIVQALKDNGGDVKYNEYENVGHNVWMNALGEKDLMPWLLASEVTIIFMEHEAWLSGNLEGIAPILMPSAHALTQAAIDIKRASESLSDEEMWKKPNDSPSVAFHLRHIAGSIDRLLTYTRGEQLNSQQFDELAAESKFDENADSAKLIESAVSQIENAVDFLRRVDVETLFEKRVVGRKELPTNVFGLLFHIAEHTQRHVGQIITTAKIVGVR